jgi:hypothetical protein
MVNHPQRFIAHLVHGALFSALLIGCGGQGTGGDAGTGSTGPDATQPQLVAKFPDAADTSVATNSDIALQFSEPLNVSRMSSVASAVRLYQAIEGEISLMTKAVRWDAQSNTLYVRPNTFFDASRHYTVEVTNGLKDVAGNQLDTGPDGVITWRFTTSDVFDDQAPAWNEPVTVRAIPDRFDTITVCWWSGPPPNQDGCDPVVVDPLPSAATDLPSDGSSGVLYTVEYRRSTESTFTSLRSGLSHRVTLTELLANTEYEIQIRAKDTAGNQTDTVVSAAAVKTPKAGRLYVANHTGNGVSMFTDVGQAVGNKPATVVTADETRLVAPSGVAVDTLPDDPSQLDPDGYVYVAEPLMNRIAAYKLRSDPDPSDQIDEQVELGTYGVSQNTAPAWTIEGSLTLADVTGLCGPSTLYLERRANGDKILYVANALTLVGPSSQVCRPDNILVFDVTEGVQGANQAPNEIIKRPTNFFAPIAFAVDKTHNLLYVANRDDVSGVGDNRGWKIDVYDLENGVLSNVNLAQAPSRHFWGMADGPCFIPTQEPGDRICGPTALAYDATYDRLFVANRGKHNILVFNNVSEPATTGSQTPVVVAGPKTGLDQARPVGLFLDSVRKRLHVTTDSGQSVLIFDTSDPDILDADPGVFSGDVLPLRVIRGTKTMLGQPAINAALQSRGPFAVTVARKTVTNAGGQVSEVDEAFVVTPGLFGATGLTPVPSLAAFNVSAGKDPPTSTATTLAERTTNTVPDRVVVNPLLGASAVALDTKESRLYVASFHANAIAVYNDPLDFSNGRKSPDRIIMGPDTLLDHPIALLFRRLDQNDLGSLYVVNQSSHSVAVFEEGEEGTGTEPNTLLTGNVAPTRYIGPPEGTVPFDDNANLTQMVFPTGLAIDPENDILYLSNRDAEEFQDVVGRRIVAFPNARIIGADDQDSTTEDHNLAPTWKIEGVEGATNQTLLSRPAGLWLIPDPDPDPSTPADDWLVVANRGGGTILFFQGVSARVQAAVLDPRLGSYDQRPTAIAPTPLNAPIGLAFDGTYRDLYVSDGNQILAIHLSEDMALSATPRVIVGASTGLSGPYGLALDPLN